MSQQPSVQPNSVLRGHRVQVHAASFIRHNQRLASGDADGFVVLWDLTIMRPRAVWQAHKNAILGVAGWGDDKIITHGRDNKLVVWKLAAEDEAALSTALPLDDSAPERPQPWVLNILEVNTMNFCSFASCTARSDGVSDELLVAVPNTLATESVDVYQLPSQNRQHTIHLGSKSEKMGMVMALSLFWHYGSLTLAAGYENGLATVARRRRSGSWDVIYKAQAHSQPILSLDVAPGREYFLTSSADAVIAKHPIPLPAAPEVSSTAPVVPEAQGIRMGAGPFTNTNPSRLSASVSAQPPMPAGLPKKIGVPVETKPLKTVNTKHSGQQGLRIRSDGRIFATAGWDSKVRVYSAKTMAELVVLKWHDVGCYAVAFTVLDDGGLLRTGGTEQKKARVESEDGGGTGVPKDKGNAGTVVPVPRRGGLTVKDRRIKMAKEAHWLAAGSKDGKISLWDIY